MGASLESTKGGVGLDEV